MSVSDHQSPAHLSVSADDASIHLVIGPILDAVTIGELPPSILRLRRIGDGIDVEATPLDGCHPSELLIGHRVDDRYFALGIAARGWAYHAEAHPDDRARVSVVSIMSRTGEHANATRADDPDHPVNAVDEAPTAGEQVDVMKRCLGLDTESAPCPSSAYWHLEWLASIVDEVMADGDVDEPDLMEWADVRALHPAAVLLRTGGVDPDEYDFVEMAESFGRITDWARIRSMIDNGGYAAVGLRAGDGAWFDDGSIARYLLARIPPTEFMIGVIRRGVTADAMAHIEGYMAREQHGARHCHRRAG